MSNQMNNIPSAVTSIAQRFSIPLTKEKTVVDILSIVAQPIVDRITGNVEADADLIMVAAEEFNVALASLDGLKREVEAK